MSGWSRLRNAIHSRRLDESIDDEIQDHLERRAAALREEGVSPDEARRRALAAFGSVTRVREQSRDIRLWVGLENTTRDMRYAWRTMLRTPAFTITAVLSLALAIGANTAIYAIVDAALFRPLPVPEARTVFTLTAPGLDGSETESFSYPVYLQLRAAAGDSASLAAIGPTDRADAQNLDPTTPVTRIRQQFISSEALEVLRTAPTVGWLFSEDDDRAAATPASALVSFDYWQRQFGGDPRIVGRSLTLNGRPFRIVGVASKEFFGVEPGRFVDVWVPLTTFDPGVFSNPDAALFRIVGRMNEQTTPEQLQTRLQGVYRDHQQRAIVQHPEVPAAALSTFRARQIHVHMGGVGASAFERKFARPIWIIWMVAAAILLVACANVASLLLSRSVSRSNEMLLRTSLGASRTRLIRQLLTESLLLAGSGSLLGLIVARSLAPWLVRWLSMDSEPVRLNLTMDTRVLLACAVLCAAATLMIGLLPAWQGTSGPRAFSWIPGRDDARKAAIGRAFASVQVAFVFCLVVVGTGFLVTLLELARVAPGFDPRQVTVLTLRSDLGPKQDGLTLTQQLQRQVSMRPNVEGAAVGWWAIFGDDKRTEQIVLNGKAASDRQEIFSRVSPGYFATLKTPLLDGRDFDVRDTDGAQPIPSIVNQSFAQRYFGQDAVVGREFRRRSDGARHVIVGVSADAYYSDLRSGLQPVVYFPMKPPRFFTLYIRSALDAGTVRRLVEREARDVGPGLHVVEVTTLETLIGNTLSKEKLLAGIGGLFAALGLVLVAIGLFGLLSYSVARRTKEIGLRAALGAQHRALAILVLREMSGVMVGGLIAGMLASVVLTRIVRSQLYGMAAVDPLMMTVSAAVFLLVTAMAIAVPTYRAATMDPLVALRQD